MNQQIECLVLSNRIFVYMDSNERISNQEMITTTIESSDMRNNDHALKGGRLVLSVECCSVIMIDVTWLFTCM